jgi:hypothetical protein
MDALIILVEIGLSLEIFSIFSGYKTGIPHPET